MAWNLAELSKIETDPLRKSIIDTLIMEIPVAEIIPWETIGQLSTTIVRYKDLPSVGWRKINEAYSESTGHFEHKVENISLLGADIDTDIAIARAKNTIGDARAIMQTMMMKSVSYEFNYKFIAGNPTTDPDEFKGLKLRIDDIVNEGFTNQRFACNDTDTGILYDTAARHNFLNDLDKLLYAIKGHKPDFMLMNQKMLLALRAVLRMEKLLDSTKDMFDRIVDVYQGARLVDIGLRANQTTEIILNTETAAGAVSAGTECTSIYAAKFSMGDMCWGIQEYPLEARDLGEIQTKPVYRTRVDWPVGLATVDPRSLARMYGIVPDATS